MAVIDGQRELIDMISSNWDNSKTSNITPNFGKITDFPFEMQYGDGKGYVLVYSQSENESLPGIGLTTRADVSEIIRIDIRYGGMGHKSVEDIETIFLQFKAELKRILYSNVQNPTTNYCILNLSNQSIQNLSNRAKKFFREIRDVDLQANNRDLTI